MKRSPPRPLNIHISRAGSHPQLTQASGSSIPLVLSSLSLCVSFCPPVRPFPRTALPPPLSLPPPSLSIPFQKPMGRKPDDPDELLARAKANGYRRREHREQDAVPDRHI